MLALAEARMRNPHRLRRDNFELHAGQDREPFDMVRRRMEQAKPGITQSQHEFLATATTWPTGRPTASR